jgi:leucyl/phenylalanyl-tRNA--protein transferase
MDCCGVTRGINPAGVLDMYARGIFPMGSSEHEYITWHRPERRAILPLDGFHVSRSLERTLRRAAYSVTLDAAFADVIAACADRADGTWITPAIQRTYLDLHGQGHAHSLEVWLEGSLAGGVYGVHIGGAFFAESKFHRATDMSKVALYHLTEHLRARDFSLLEVQYLTPHLASLGVIEISDHEYTSRLRAAIRQQRSWR